MDGCPHQSVSQILDRPACQPAAFVDVILRQHFPSLDYITYTSVSPDHGSFYNCTVSPPLMFSRLNQVARHLSRPLPNYLHNAAGSGLVATRSMAQERSKRMINTAACLIIGDEVRLYGV